MSPSPSLASSRSAWRFMPAGVAGWLAITALVNGAMVYHAIHSFPGNAGDNAFDLSNSYDRVIETSAQEAQLGWTVKAGTAERIPVLQVHAGSGEAAQVEAAARRPLGPEHRVALTFSRQADGRYVGSPALPLSGQWDLAVVVRQGSHALHVTRRVVVP